MRNPGIFRGAFIFLFFIGLFALASLGVMYLWNWLIPAVIGWSVINYWQALGFMVLCRLLFGGFRGFGHFGPFGHHPGGFFFGNREEHNRFHEQMKNMPWEERREHIRRHMADFRNGRFNTQEPSSGDNAQ